jgi:pimeloyl-ACP methyl ester carboxylesterase
MYHLEATWRSPGSRRHLTMATFVLVHGAWHGGWCYARTAKLLRDQGHDVFTPTLTGLGERSHLASAAINLSVHIQDVINTIKWEGLTDVVLCGHSYGGMVITGVADQLAERIRSLVYLDAFVPESGKALWDYVDAEFHSFFMQTAGAGGGQVAPSPAAAFNVNAKDAPWVDQNCVPMAISCFLEQIKLTGKHTTVKKRAFIFATGWENATSPTSAFKPFYEKAKADPGWIAMESKVGHDVMVDDPQGLAMMFIKAI